MIMETDTGSPIPRFAYALVSAVPLQDSTAAGIGVLFKARDRSTVGSICQALPNTEPLMAAYEALMRVLEEALRVGSRRITVYIDPPEVVRQLEGEAEVPRWALVKHLKARGMINQLGSVKLVAATRPGFSARLLAQGATPSDEGTCRDSKEARRNAADEGRGPGQLSLLGEDPAS